MRGTLYLLCGLVGGIAGAVCVSLLDSEPSIPARDTRRDAAPGGIDHGPEIEALRRDLRRIEALLERAAPPPVPMIGGDGTVAARSPGRVTEPGGAKPEAVRDEAAVRSVADLVRSLRGKGFGYDEANTLFSWSVRNKDKIKDVVKALEKEVAADPTNADLRVALASAWVGELVNNTPTGTPQQGLVWRKAAAAYDKALELDPTHWQAGYGKAFGTSRIPEYLGLRPVAIKQFEELVAQQERVAPEPHHEQTYFRLGTLYKDAGNAEKAREVWDRGLSLLPNSKLLKGTLEASTKK